MSYKERGRTPQRTFNLEKLSPLITSCLKIEAAYIRYNAIDTLFI
jgi:hypothetical protein